ncbi:MAG: LysR family transcriptional regulator [Alphaproteobacteria bacterium]|nr:LysR family transcriptional regulator [Alphaproteobacteria bacterium]
MAIAVRHLAAFEALADTLNFTRAAERLGLTQPALSATIQQLEAEVGVKLVERSSRAVRLTAAGSRVRPAAVDALWRWQAGVEEVRRLARSAEAVLSLSLVPSVMRLVLGDVVAFVSAELPDLRLATREASSEQVWRQVANGEATLGVATPWADADRSLEVEPLVADPFTVVLRPDHPLASRPALTWADLAAWPVIGLPRDTGVAQTLASHTSLPDAVRRPAHEATSSSGLRAMLEGGLGVAALPVLAAPVWAGASLVYLPVTDPSLARPLALIRRADHVPDAGERRLVAFLRARLEALTAMADRSPSTTQPVAGPDSH